MRVIVLLLPLALAQILSCGPGSCADPIVVLSDGMRICVGESGTWHSEIAAFPPCTYIGAKKLDGNWEFACLGGQRVLYCEKSCGSPCSGIPISIKLEEGQFCYYCVSTAAENCQNGVDDDGDGLVDCADPDCQVDADSDSYLAPPCGNDCDDLNPNIHPGAPEVCDNGLDDDCDGLVDCSDPDCASYPACIPAEVKGEVYCFTSDGTGNVWVWSTAPITSISVIGKGSSGEFKFDCSCGTCTASDKQKVGANCSYICKCVAQLPQGASVANAFAQSGQRIITGTCTFNVTQTPAAAIPENPFVALAVMLLVLFLVGRVRR